MKTLTVIGGSGFFGLSILDYFNDSSNLYKWKIKNITFLSRKSKNYKKYLSNKNFIFLKEDIIKSKSLPKSDYIIYAINSYNIKYDLLALKNFCKIIKRDFKKCNIIFTSSGAVYGDHYDHKNNNKKSYKESKKISIKNLNNLNRAKITYAETKIQSELLLKKIATKRIKVSIARCYTFIGPNILKYKKYFISNILKCIINKKPLLVKSRYKVYRSFMCYTDLTEWLLTIMNKSKKRFDVYNVGSDKVIEIHNLVKQLSKIYSLEDKSKKIINRSVDFYVPDTKKAKKNLGLRSNNNIVKVIHNTLKELNYTL